MNREFNRREFLKVQLKSGLFLAAAANGLLLPGFGRASTPPDLGIVTGDAEAAVRKAVDLMGGMKTVVKKGQRVLIKPNMSFARSPEAASNTHPDVVKTVAALCLEAGASRVSVLDHTLGPAKACVQTSGIGPALAGMENVAVHFINNPDLFRQVDLPGSKTLLKTDVAREFLEADVLIAVPVAKSHSSTGVSLSMKGMMGLVYDRAVMHRTDLHETIVDLAGYLKPALTIIDGTRVLSTGGPGGPGKVIRAGTIIASRDMVAADACAVDLFEWYGSKFKPTRVRHIRLAHERGLGRADIEKLVIQRAAV